MRSGIPRLKRKGTLKNIRVPFLLWTELLGSEDCVLGGFGHAEFDHALGSDLDRFASGGIATHAGFAIYLTWLAESGQSESVLRVFVGQIGNGSEDLASLFFGDAVFFSDC